MINKKLREAKSICLEIETGYDPLEALKAFFVILESEVPLTQVQKVTLLKSILTEAEIVLNKANNEIKQVVALIEEADAQFEKSESKRDEKRHDADIS